MNIHVDSWNDMYFNSLSNDMFNRSVDAGTIGKQNQHHCKQWNTAMKIADGHNTLTQYAGKPDSCTTAYAIIVFNLMTVFT